MGDTTNGDERAAKPLPPPPAGWRLPRQFVPELIRLLLRTPPPEPGRPEPTAEEIASANITQQEVIEEVISEVERELVVDREYRF